MAKNKIKHIDYDHLNDKIVIKLKKKMLAGAYSPKKIRKLLKKF